MQDAGLQDKRARAALRAEDKARSRYAIRPLAVADIDALTKHTPSIGCQYVLLSMRGAVHPPLYFHNGGIKAMLAVIKQHVRLVKTRADPNTYVVTDDCGPLSPQLSIDGSDVQQGGPPRGEDTVTAPAAVQCASPPPSHSPSGNCRPDWQPPP